MMLNWRFLFALAIFSSSAGVFPQAAFAEDEELIVEEVITLGTRSVKPRSVSDSPVPVDVISADDFNAMGNTADLTDNLKALVPSYTATPATGDGSAFVRPTSLRGTAPDQTLVLVNGKRRHRSALVQFFAPAAGNGAHGVDVGMIPGIALKSVEVLRDGAASQYGSDAIAGVINFVLKDAAEGGEVQVQYGQHFEGEDSLKFAGNAGFAVFDDGFVNASLEYTDNDGLSRGIQRADAQDLIDSGVTEVGQDAVFGDAPLAQTWGRPRTEGVRFYLNSGFPLTDTSDLYARLGYADTKGRYRFFYRINNPDMDPDLADTHPTLMALQALGFTGLRGGYTPYLDGEQEDTSFVTGVAGVYPDDTTFDFSVGLGKNELDYFLNNTINQDLGLVGGNPAQRDFDVGGYEQKEVNLNVDFSTPLSDVLNLAYGAEWRKETYTAVAGEPNSYLGAGSNGLKGISRRDAGDFSRDNYAVYGDLEYDVNDMLFTQYALRYEDFSDFGSTLNGKFAARVNMTDTVTLRGAISTGFHAPTPGQANVRTTITTFDGMTGMQVEEGLVPSTDPRVADVGGTALTEEKSKNISIGITADIGDRTNLTFDLYQIEVDDRIYRTGDIPVPGTTDATISFYTNALDVEHSGADLVLTSGFDWNDNASTDLALAFSHGKTDVVDQKKVGAVDPVNPVNDGLVEDIENNYPENRWVLTTNTIFGERTNLMARATFYGKHFDERGRIGAAELPSAEIDSTLYFDLELGFQVNDNFRLAVGGINVFDEFIDEIGLPNDNRLSVGLQYPRRSAANYEGGSWYLRGAYSFP
ncbi:MAG: TonB-dependent receptor [Gammaproteobacteria bacterium]|nr:TonB-dependent receptor [Gammaproteobacteria bacterium]